MQRSTELVFCLPDQTGASSDPSAASDVSRLQPASDYGKATSSNATALAFEWSDFLIVARRGAPDAQSGPRSGPVGMAGKTVKHFMPHQVQPGIGNWLLVTGYWLLKLVHLINSRSVYYTHPRNIFGQGPGLPK